LQKQHKNVSDVACPSP